MTTVGANFVSTHYLGQQPGGAGHAGSVATHQRDDRGIDRPIRQSRPAARRPVRLRAFAEGTGRPAPDADYRQQCRFDQPVDGAERAIGHPEDRPDDAQQSRSLESSRRFRPIASEHGSIGARGADQRGQYDIGRSICVRRNQFRRRADVGLLFDPRLSRQDGGRQGFSDHVRRPAERSRGGRHLRLGHAELSFRAVRGALPERFVEHRLVLGFERQHERADRAGSDRHDIDQRQSAGLPTAGPGVHDAERIRRVRAQQRCAAGRGHGRVLARFAGREFDDQHSSRRSARARAPSPAPTIR